MMQSIGIQARLDLFVIEVSRHTCVRRMARGDVSVTSPMMSHIVRPSQVCALACAPVTPPTAWVPEAVLEPLPETPRTSTPSSSARHAPGAGQSVCSSLPDIMPAAETCTIFLSVKGWTHQCENAPFQVLHVLLRGMEGTLSSHPIQKESQTLSEKHPITRSSSPTVHRTQAATFRSV